MPFRWRALLALVGLLLGILLGIRTEPELGRRPDTWPSEQVPVRYVAEQEFGDDGPIVSPGEDPDQPPIVIRGHEPTEWSLGTGFVVDTMGVLLTAAHVTDGCSQLAIDRMTSDDRLLFASEIVQHATADVAVVRGPHAGRLLPLGDDRALERGMTAFGFGFPAGVPSVIEGELMGRARGRSEDVNAWSPMLVWSLVSRSPDSAQPLGGISGGPMLDPDGRVIGVVIASGSDRRPRVITTTMDPVRTVLVGATRRMPADGVPAVPIASDSAPGRELALRVDRTVVPLICRSKRAERRARG